MGDNGSGQNRQPPCVKKTPHGTPALGESGHASAAGPLRSEKIVTLKSDSLGNERLIWIQPPLPHLPPSPHCVIFLDGEIYRDRVGAGDVIASMQASGSIANPAIVYVSMANPEARWIESPCYPPFATFLAEELLPLLATELPTGGAAVTRTLVGLSYSGLAAAYAAFSQPGLFHQVISQSGSFWSQDAWLVRQVRLLKKPLPTRFFLSVGDRETQSKVRHRADLLQTISQIDSIRQLRDALMLTGHEVKYVEMEGFHEFMTWRRALPPALLWALAQTPIRSEDTLGN